MRADCRLHRAVRQPVSVKPFLKDELFQSVVEEIAIAPGQSAASISKVSPVGEYAVA